MLPNNKSLLDDMDTLALIDERDLSLILDKLYREGGYDFRGYKRSSMARRISMRLKTYKVSPMEYLNILDSDPEEYNRLFSYLTIKVSEFFRDPRVFAAIKKIVIPEIFSQRDKSSGTGQRGNESHRGIRVWCCGCAQQVWG